MNKFCLFEPLFSRIEIFSLYNIPIKENNITYLANIEKKGFFDLKVKPIKEEQSIISKVKYEGKEENLPTPSLHSVSIYGGKDKRGDIIHCQSKNTEKDSFFLQLMKDKGIRAVLGGAIGGAIGAPFGIGVSAMLGLTYAGYGFHFDKISKSYDNALNYIHNLFK